MSAALLPNVAGAGHTVFEADGQAAYLIDAATAAQIEEISKKIEVLGGKVELAMKKLPARSAAGKGKAAENDHCYRPGHQRQCGRRL